MDETTRRLRAKLRAEQIKRFGESVRAARDANGWTQEELAHRSELAVVQISRIERGVREIRLTTLLRLLTALEIEPTTLLDGLYGERST